MFLLMDQQSHQKKVTYQLDFQEGHIELLLEQYFHLGQM